MAKSRDRKKKIILEEEPRRFPAFLTRTIRDELAAIAGDPTLASRWQEGRQGTGYEKLDLRLALDDDALEDHRALLDAVLTQARVSLSKKIRGWDAYILRYRDGAHVPDHTDPTTEAPHLRLNAIIRGADEGTGQFRLRGEVFDLDEGDAVLFRPDRLKHRVSEVRGERLVLSVGCMFDRE